MIWKKPVDKKHRTKGAEALLSLEEPSMGADATEPKLASGTEGEELPPTPPPSAPPIHERYPHVVPDSLRLVTKGELVDGIVSKGKVVTIKCTECGANRTVNLQDAFQVKRCRACQQARVAGKLQTLRSSKTPA